MRLEAHSRTPTQLFEAVARQLFSQIIDPAGVGAALREKVGVEGESLDHLLREWVVTLLEFLQTQKMVFKEFRITELKMPDNGPYLLRAEATGELFDPQRHDLTPHATRLACREVHLRKDAQGYRAEINLEAMN